MVNTQILARISPAPKSQATKKKEMTCKDCISWEVEPCPMADITCKELYRTTNTGIKRTRSFIRCFMFRPKGRDDE